MIHSPRDQKIYLTLRSPTSWIVESLEVKRPHLHQHQKEERLVWAPSKVAGEANIQVTTAGNPIIIADTRTETIITQDTRVESHHRPHRLERSVNRHGFGEETNVLTQDIKSQDLMATMVMMPGDRIRIIVLVADPLHPMWILTFPAITQMADGATTGLQEIERNGLEMIAQGRGMTDLEMMDQDQEMTDHPEIGTIVTDGTTEAEIGIVIVIAIG